MEFLPVFSPNTTLAFGQPVIVGSSPYGVGVTLDPFGRPIGVVASPMVVQTTTTTTSSSSSGTHIPPIDPKCCIKDPNDYKQLNKNQWKAVYLSKKNKRLNSWQYTIKGTNFRLRRQHHRRGVKSYQIKEGRGDWTTLYFFDGTYNPPYYKF